MLAFEYKVCCYALCTFVFYIVSNTFLSLIVIESKKNKELKFMLKVLFRLNYILVLLIFFSSE